MSQNRRVFTSAEAAQEALRMQNKTLFLTLTLNKIRIDLDVENTDNTADTNKIT